jgi:alpha-ketoglutarate-dependent 2,4-dichlorophenoxyacetate dioxygenase
LKAELISNDYVVAHSLFHSRKLGSPEFFAHVNPLDHKMARHKLVQVHEPSGRMNLYVARHAHHVEGLEPEESDKLLERLIDHATQDKYTIEVPWHGVGDLVMWDNTCVMHRATGGSFEGRFKRDMMRTTVHDGSSTAWGLNEQGDVKQGFAFT